MANARAKRRQRTVAFPWRFLIAMLLVAVNLRAPFVAVAPITSTMRLSLGVSAGRMGLLTGLPVLCFGLAAPLALLIARRRGPEQALTACLAAVIAGCAIRSGGPYLLAAAGTIVMGLGITIGNVVIPVLIRRDTPAEDAGLVTGGYTAIMNVGSMIVLVAMAPLADAIGWRAALVLTALPAIAGLALWLAFVSHSTPAGITTPASAEPVGEPRTEESTRRTLGWVLALTFACQATSYYSITAWLPTLLHDTIGLARTSAGDVSSVFQVFALIGAFGVPLLSRRVRGPTTIVIVGVLWMSFPIQLLVDPRLYLVGSMAGGVAQGGGFAAVMTLVVRLTRTDRESARLSALVQGVGYVVAAAGPTTLGIVHDSSGGWRAPIAIMVAVTSLFTLLGTFVSIRAARL